MGNNFLGTAYSALFSSFDRSFGSGVEGGVSSTSSVFNDALSGADMANKSSSSSAPRAYLNYIFFDREMNYVTAGFQQISTAALRTAPNDYEQISLNEIIADQEGYLLAYVSNENQEAVNIFFDDFTVYHGKTNVVQAQNFYPFGMSFGNYQRTSSMQNRYLFNQGIGDTKFATERIFELRVDMTKRRMYDYVIGRFWQVDPMANYRVWVNPYNYVQNNPLIRIDPTGMLDDYLLDEETGEISLIKETDDDFDVLYAQNDEGGADESNSIQVEKGILDNPSKDEVQTKNGSVKTTTYDMTGDTQGEALHEFVATNSNVEWGLTQAGETGSEGVNILSTSNQKSSEAGSVTAMKKIQGLGISLRRHVHSHPANTPFPSTGDLKFWGKWSKDSSIFQIFTPENKKYVTYPNLLPEVEVNPDKN